MKTIFSIFVILLSFSVSAQFPEYINVDPLNSYEEVCEEGIFNTIGNEWFPFDAGVEGSKRVYIVQVDQRVTSGEENIFLSSKGFKLLSKPSNYFFGVVSQLDIEDEYIVCPLDDSKNHPLYLKIKCDCLGSDKSKVTRLTGPDVWGGGQGVQLYFLAERIDPI
jgi:hypothetical protein